MRLLLVSLCLLFCLSVPALSAPLFPDVPEDHWARDAVATLAARGLVEGYPDGTFKGDRAASRWEVAMIVARLLARMEAEHATFAAKADLEEVRKLAAALRQELDALGVRVTNLEEATGRLDQRVADLERIRFHGSLRAMANAQSFVNHGSPAMVPAAGGPATIDYNAAVGSAAGAGGLLPGGLPFNAFVFGVLPVVEWGWGRPLTNGTGFTSVARLGFDTDLAGPELQAGVDLAAYTSQGDAVVDAFWGLPAPYLSNVFTGISGTGAGAAGAGAQPQNQQPWTRMTLDRAWLWWDPITSSRLQQLHAAVGLPWKPRVQVVLGAHRDYGPEDTGTPLLGVRMGSAADAPIEGMLREFANTGLDPALYVPVVNPSDFGSRPWNAFNVQKRDYFLPSFGVQATGHEEFGEQDDLSLWWGAMGTRLPNGVGEFLLGTGAGYFNHAEGGDLALRYGLLSESGALNMIDQGLTHRGQVRVSFLHAANEALGGTALAVGLLQSAGSPTGDWVNPSGFFVNQLGGAADPRVAGVNTTSDVRPIVTVTGLDGIAGVPGVPNFGGLGPQDQTGYGISAEHYFDPFASTGLPTENQAVVPWVKARYAHTDYRPQKNSSYSASGSLWEAEAGARFLFGLLETTRALDVKARYVSVDPRYDPFIAYFPTVAGISSPLWVSPNFSYFADLYALHDTQRYTHNRKGFEGEVSWAWDLDLLAPEDPFSYLYVRYGSFDQVRTSLQDVRYSPGALGASGTGPIPNSPVLGYSPGFIDGVFGPYSAATFFDPGTGNGLEGVREDERGRMRNLSAVARHQWHLEHRPLAAEELPSLVREPLTAAQVQVPTRSVSLYGGTDYYNFQRDSRLSSLVAGPAGLAGENQNYVDLTFFGWMVGVGYDVTKDFEVYGRFTNVEMYGHLDPLNVYGAWAAASGNPRATVIDIVQTYPELGFQWKVADNMTWGLNGRYYTMKDHVPGNVTPSPAVPGLNLDLGVQAGAHPFNWSGYQLWSDFSVKF